MKNSYCWIIFLAIFLLMQGYGTAATTHPVNVYMVDDYVTISITGTASLTLTADDFNNGIFEKALTSSVQINLKSKKLSCSVLASAPNFSPGFAIDNLQVRIDSPGEVFHNLANTPVLIGSYPNRHNNKYPILFKMTNIQQLGTIDAGSYNTTVTYTVVTPAI